MDAKKLFARALNLKKSDPEEKSAVTDFDYYIGAALKPYLSKADIETLIEMARRYEYFAFAGGLQRNMEEGAE